ncbi:MAG: 50S ribosomal protein L18 [Candidatus Thermoplasmatota archaeon]|nr:50S ribosomal protein L18 [Candidatus Thermoplasmatota archaeon]
MNGTRRRSVFRRRQSGQTDYHRRLKLLRGRKARAVVRVSNTRVTCQMVNWSAGGDMVVASVTGSDLTKKYDWPADFSQKSVPACYLAGFALGKESISKGCTEAVLDIGLAGSTVGGRVFSALKGMIDAGMEIPHSEVVLPEDDRINGEHISDKIGSAVEATKNKIEGAY